MSCGTDSQLKAARDDFPLLKQKVHGKPLVYLDSAATAQKPQSVIDALSHFYANDYATVNRAVYSLSSKATEAYHNSRLKAQSLLNAKHTEEIIFTRGTTESLNLIAYSFGKAFIQPGDEILISEMEHHANIVPWQILVEDRQAVLKVIPIDDRGAINLEAYKSLLSEKTKLVSIAHVSNVLGTENPIREMAKLAHEKGAKVVVDGAQAVPHMIVDVQELLADFYVFSGHKYYGPTGIGVLYGKKELLESMPPYQGGGDMIKTVTFEKTTYNTLPMKFEAGTPLIAEAIGLGAAIDYLGRYSMKSIQEYCRHLQSHAEDNLSKISGVHVHGTAKSKGPIVSFTHESAHPLDIGTLLDMDGIAIRTGHLCAQPTMKRFGTSHMARASFTFYNTLDEVNAFCERLENALKLLDR